MDITFENAFLCKALNILKMPFQKTSKLKPLPPEVKNLLKLRPGNMVRVVCRGTGYEDKAQGKVRKLSTKARMRKQLRLA